MRIMYSWNRAVVINFCFIKWHWVWGDVSGNLKMRMSDLMSNYNSEYSYHFPPFLIQYVIINRFLIRTVYTATTQGPEGGGGVVTQPLPTERGGGVW